MAFFSTPNMANKRSALKRIRSNSKKRLQNKYELKTSRTFTKKLKLTTDKKEGSALLGKVTSMLDKLAKKRKIHRNKAARNKSILARHINNLPS